MAKKTDNDLEVLAPESVTWEIGGESFQQSPATLDQLADIMDVIVDEVLASGKGELLDRLMDTATATAAATADGEGDSPEKVAKESISDRETLTSFVRIIATLPRAMPRITAKILDGSEDFFRANLRPKEAFGVLRTFITQNDVGSIIQDFFGLFNEMKSSVVTKTSDSD